MKKRLLITSIVINLIIVLLEIFVMLQSFIQWMPEEDKKICWYQALTYYTEDSNISLLIGSLATLIGSVFLLKDRESKWSFILLKYLGIVTTMVTFTTVYFFMISYSMPSLGFSIHGNLWLLTHTVCPILGIISFLFFDEKKNISLKMVIVPII